MGEFDGLLLNIGEHLKKKITGNCDGSKMKRGTMYSPEQDNCKLREALEKLQRTSRLEGTSLPKLQTLNHDNRKKIGDSKVNFREKVTNKPTVKKLASKFKKNERVKTNQEQHATTTPTESLKGTKSSFQGHSQMLRDALDKVRSIQIAEVKPKLTPVSQDAKPERPRIQKEMKRKYEGSDDEEVTKKSKHTYISSIFSGNPEAPPIHQSKTTKRKEKVFASEYFKDLSIHPFMLSNLESAFGVTRMTTVQKISIPSILEGRDVLVKSQTGSGKTLAYAVPVIQELQSRLPKVQRSDGVLALVIVPTRELALQSYECFQKLVKSFTWVVPGYLVGGEKKKSEKSRIRKGINVLISTPGRLIDHLEHTSNLSLKKAKYLVFDEADRLLDMGYEKDVSKIIQILSEQSEVLRQTLMLSATLTSGVEHLAGLSLTNPVVADAANEDESDVLGTMVTPEKLIEYYLIAPMKLRLVSLATFIMYKCQQKSEKLLVFFPTQSMVDLHTQLLGAVLPGFIGCMDPDSDNEDDNPANCKLPRFFRLHGNMSQTERTQVFKDFRGCRAGVLLCTDVAARGLDLPSVHWIVQYNAPPRPAEYVHRVGRTARIGESGRAVLFLLPSETDYISVLQDSNISLKEMQLNEVLDNILLVTGESNVNLKGKGSNAKTENAATDLQLQFENFLLQNDSVLQIARDAFHSYIRFYASYPFSLKRVFHYKSLHLGHVAKSLGLRETPSQLGCSITTSSKDLKYRQKSREATKQLKRQESKKIYSEYESGVEQLDLDLPSKSARNKGKRPQASGKFNKSFKPSWKVLNMSARRGKPFERRAPII